MTLFLDPHLQTAALRMVLTLARIPEGKYSRLYWYHLNGNTATARTVCSAVKPRMRELASKDERLVGLLAVEILLALYDPTERSTRHISGLVFSSPNQRSRPDQHSRWTRPS